MDTVRARWVENRQWVGFDSLGHSIVMDTPVANGGEGTGFRPVEMVLVGLAACTGIDVVSILKKKREDVRAVEIIVNGEQTLEEYPHYYANIDIEYVVTGVRVKPESVARSIELSEEKYCAVKGAFGPQVHVTTRYRVEEFMADVPVADD